MAAYYKVEVTLNSQAVQVGLPSPQSVRVTLPLVGPQGLQGVQGEVGPIGPVGPQGEQGIQGEVGPAGTTDYTQLQNVPATFPPSAHTHTPSEVGLGNVANAAQVTAVTGTAPIVSSGGTTPAISISAATTAAAGSMSAADKLKLDGIAAGAEVNVNADWNASSGDAQIINKPTLGGAAALNVGTTAGTVAAGNDSRFADAAALTTGTLADARLSTNVPLKDASNTFTQNQTLDGTNNVAPNQTAASGSSLMTRALSDDRYFFLRNNNIRVINVWANGGGTSVSGGSVGYNGLSLNVRANAGAGNRARWTSFLHIGTTRGLDWSKRIRGTIVFNLNGDSRGTVRALIGENNSYTNGLPTRPCAGFRVTGNTLTAFVHDGTTLTDHGTASISLSGNNWAFANRVFEFISDGAGNISYSLDGTAITGGSGARTTQSNLSEAIHFVSESDAACTGVTDIEPLQVVVEQAP